MPPSPSCPLNLVLNALVLTLALGAATAGAAEPAATTDPAVGAAPAPAPEIAPAAGEAPPAEAAPPRPAPAAETPEAQELRLSSCSIPQEAEFFGFEWARRTSYRSVCLASHWLDGLFGDNPFDPKEGQINGYFALVTEKREDGGWDSAPRIRTRIKLPQASKRFDLFFDRDRESQTIASESAALHPETSAATEESTNQVGIGYLLHQGMTELLNVRLGLRVRSEKLDLFARSQYTAIFAENPTGRWNFQQTLFWRTTEGFGETTALEYERHIGGPNIFRWSNSATYSEITDGFRWNSVFSLFHALNEDRAIQWSYGANGESGQVESIASHGPRVSYRQRLEQRWLVVEVYTGIDNIKDELMTSRREEAYVGARIEAHFSPQ
ncbi:MAG TPA: hypothetical protein VFH22_05485 [Rhodocyclaceae bacterium]|nr:hypothetical protein [Rhodocyclaceae bacterium]